MPVITSGPITRSVGWGSTTACFTACSNAKSAALAALQTAALAPCPKGYKIVSKPTCSAKSIHDRCTLTWASWFSWPRVNCTDQCEAEIVCDTSGKFPSLLIASAGSALLKWKEMGKAWEEHYAAVHDAYGRIESIREPEQLAAAVETWIENVSCEGVDVDAEPFFAALHAGEIAEVRPPALQTLLDELDLWGNSAIQEEAVRRALAEIDDDPPV